MDAVINYINKMVLSLLFSVSIISACFSQTNTILSEEINKSVGNAFIMLNDSLQKEQHHFLIKMVVDDQSLISSVEISDSVDPFYKEIFLDNLSLIKIQKQLKASKDSARIVLIPVYIISIDIPKTYIMPFLKYSQFNGKALNGLTYMMPACIIRTKFSQN
jgi:hypothetical protein